MGKIKRYMLDASITDDSNLTIWDVRNLQLTFILTPMVNYNMLNAKNNQAMNTQVELDILGDKNYWAELTLDLSDIDSGYNTVIEFGCERLIINTFNIFADREQMEHVIVDIMDDIENQISGSFNGSYSQYNLYKSKMSAIAENAVMEITLTPIF